MLISKNDESTDSFLVADSHSPSLPDADAAKNISVIAIKDIDEPHLAKSCAEKTRDIISIPTEAGIDVFLFWNGQTFESFMPEEVP